MLITKMKSKEVLDELCRGKKVFIINCHGCMEVEFPLEETMELEREWSEAGRLTGIYSTDYICNLENLKLTLLAHEDEIKNADAILAFSCGVGVQTLSEEFEEKTVYSGCDTYPLPGFQGVTPLEYKCDQCGECWLNLTGGICPITACSKSLVNGQCGGSKNGMCEVDPEMECGWERIRKRLGETGRLDALKSPVNIKDFSTEIEVGGYKDKKS